jgi:large subunit ribosomal protein L13
MRFAMSCRYFLFKRANSGDQLITGVCMVPQGKHKPNFTPHYDCGDYVVVVNAAHVNLTGSKLTQKKYTWHTGYPGGLKQRTVETMLERKPEEVYYHSKMIHFYNEFDVSCTVQIVRRAVMGMLAKNRLQHNIGKKLRVFPGEKHLHEDKLPAGSPSILV